MTSEGVASQGVTGEERSRLSELWSYDIVDTEPDPEFDELVRLASSFTLAPICAMSLVEEHRLWLKARVGLPVDELNREGSFCEAVVRDRAPLVVDDALTDPRFKTGALVVDAGIRAYLGYPLETASGAVLGSLCVLDVKPREWTPSERELVRVLGAQVVARLELRRANAELLRLWEERRELESRSLAGRRDDQRRLAAELHDGLGQDLTGLSLLIKSVRSQTLESTTREDLLRIEKLTRSAIGTCRRLARGQTALGFEHGNLRESLERYLAGVSEVGSVPCTLQWEKTLILRDRTVSYNLYRIVQEAVTNALRHSGAQDVRVDVKVQEGLLELEISDDGCGIESGSAIGHGVGLETMRFRAAAIGARLELLPSSPRGLLVRCTLALGPATATGGRRKAG